MKTILMVRGTKYLVHYRLRHMKWKHSFVGVYLGLNNLTGELDFSLRPIAGTCSVDAGDIVTYVESTQKCGIKT